MRTMVQKLLSKGEQEVDGRNISCLRDFYATVKKGN